MRIPKKAQRFLETLQSFEEDENLAIFDRIHIYPTQAFGCNNGGMHDARLSNVVAIRNGKHTKKTFYRKSVVAIEEDVDIRMVGIFADGSTCIVFRGYVCILETSDNLYLSNT